MRKFIKFVFSLNFLYIVLIAVQVAAIIFLCLYIPSTLPLAPAFAPSCIFAAAAAVILFSRTGAPEVKCAWFVLIASLPFAGAIIYFIASAKKQTCGCLSCADETATAIRTGYDKARYFECGEDFFECAIKEIERAKKSVYVEFYIIERGQIFERFFAALTKAKQSGAEIKIITDGVGSAFRLRRKDKKRLQKQGFQLKIFRRITPLPRTKLNFRDHRKILVVDGRVAFTGGINVADEYANLISPYGYWKDTGVAVYGEAARVFEGLFLSMFNGTHNLPRPENKGTPCTVFYDSPPCTAYCENAYAKAIYSAKERVYICTPYFCPGDRLCAALLHAAACGADVKVIIPHIPDKRYALEVSREFANSMKDGGVQFYEFTPGFIHAKCLICDGKTFLGSYNFDFRSTHFNYECGVEFDGAITDDVLKDFNATLALSARLDETKISAPKKLVRKFLKLFAPLM